MLARTALASNQPAVCLLRCKERASILEKQAFCGGRGLAYDNVADETNADEAVHDLQVVPACPRCHRHHWLRLRPVYERHLLNIEQLHSAAAKNVHVLRHNCAVSLPRQTPWQGDREQQLGTVHASYVVKSSSFEWCAYLVFIIVIKARGGRFKSRPLVHVSMISVLSTICCIAWHPT